MRLVGENDEFLDLVVLGLVNGVEVLVERLELGEAEDVVVVGGGRAELD